jgi:hypothetical protein
MIGTIQNIDTICFHIKNISQSTENPLQRELNEILSDIKLHLTNASPIKDNIDKYLGKIFNFRVKAIIWLINNKAFDFDELVNDIYPEIEKYNSDSRLQALTDNILFALRCNKRVINALSESGEFSNENIEIQETKFSRLTYNQFITSISLAIPDDYTAQKIMDWTNSSLYIEYIVLATSVIYDEKVPVSEDLINKLAHLIANAAHIYSAISMELGIIKSQHSKISPTAHSFDENTIKEQQQFAELGMDNYGKLLFDL